MASTDPVVGKVTEGDAFLSMSATGAVKSGAGRLTGFLCTASTSGTVKLWDNTAGSGTVLVETMSVSAGQFYPCPASFSTGLYATISSATITVCYG